MEAESEKWDEGYTKEKRENLCVFVQTIGLLKSCNKGVKMNIWESFFTHPAKTKFINGRTEGQ
jgi:hypothetical protein